MDFKEREFLRMRVLITGATSMIGRALSRHLVEKGHQTVAVLRRAPSDMGRCFDTPQTEIVSCSMEDYGCLAEKVCGTIDAAFLLAWNGTRGLARMDAQLQRSNEICCYALLPELKKLGCTTIITAGSQAEYGPWNSSKKLREDVVPAPNTEYGKSKLRFFQMAETFCKEHSIRLIEPRIFSLYGPDDHPGTLVMSLLRAMLSDAPCNLTQCIQTWDYLYIEDAIEGLCALLSSNEASGIYNIGSGDSHPLRHFVETMYQLSGSKSRLNYGAVPYPTTGMANTCPDVSRLRGVGWSPKTSFEMGIQRILAHMKDV